jgi:hypothetical protein
MRFTHCGIVIDIGSKVPNANAVEKWCWHCKKLQQTIDSIKYQDIT